MDNYKLELRTTQVQPIYLTLYTPDYSNSTTEILKETVYNDKKYEAFLFIPQKNNIITSIELYINGIAVKTHYDNGNLIFIDDKFEKNMIFIDIFGTVQFGIIIHYENNEIIELYSKHIHVSIKRNFSNNNILNMAKYIDQHYMKFLFSSERTSKVSSSIKKTNFKTVETYISILNEIIAEYEINYKNFKSNSKFNIVTRKKIDSFEKLCNISNSTLTYISTHPEELSKVNYNSGIKYMTSYYEPKKTLVNENIYSYDIYENRVIVGFLKYLFEIINNDYNKLLNLIISDKSCTNVIEGYVISSELSKNFTSLKIKSLIKEIKTIKFKILNMYNLYKKILNVTPLTITNIPKPSTIFLSSTHYRRIYSIIVKWFDYGAYNFEKENLLISILGSSQIYEYYILLKLCKFIEHKGYEFQQSSKYTYLNKYNILYTNTEYENTFMFSNANEEIIIYYQPIITNVIDLNKIGLFRNNSIPFSNNLYTKKRIEYYVPDFVIKIKKSTGNQYLILDAKLSNSDTIKKYYFQELVYKYLFSLSTISEIDSINGLYIFNGKSINEYDSFENIYDSSFENRNNNISPNVKILTITENSEDIETSHNRLISQAFGNHI